MKRTHTQKIGFGWFVLLGIMSTIFACQSEQINDDDVIAEDFDLAKAHELAVQENDNKGVTVYPTHRDHERNAYSRTSADLGHSSGIDE